MKIFLIGMMGAGKSTIGKILAERLKTNFYDSDSMIEQTAGLTIDLIFDIKGEDYFRALEHAWLEESKDLQGVLATGGGLPCYFDNMDWMNHIGTTVYLKTSVETIVSRLENDESRPLIKLKSNVDKFRLIAELYKNRSLYYDKSKYVIDCNVSIEGIVRSIEFVIKSKYR